MLSYGIVPTGRKIAPYGQYRGSGKGLFLTRMHETITLNRREFLRLSGAGLAGVALLGSAGCGGGGSSESGDVVFAMGVDSSGVPGGPGKQVQRAEQG